MTLPATPPAKTKPSAAPTKVKPQKTTPEAAKEFEERLARLEREAEARHEAAALDALKKRVAGGGKAPVGMPGATGKEAGSDYGSYIQSRLRDAFKTTIASQSKNPEVVVRLTIDRSGRISRSRLERSTGDKVFEDAVMRAIAKAEQNFPPPPRGEEFEQGFIFKPQGVGKK
jgi:colicin import membrane protein